MSKEIEARLRELKQSCILPAFKELPKSMMSKEALVMLGAICAQESEAKYRRQHGNGPATGLWQFERGGGVSGVLKHRASSAYAAASCRNRDIEPEPKAAWAALQTHDILAAIFARLLLWTDAKALPRIGDEKGAWDCYIRNWRPGKPHPSKWADNYAAAVKVFND